MSNRGAEIEGLLQLIVSEGLDSVVVRQVTETVGNLLEGVIMDIHGHIRWLARTAKKVCPKGIDFGNRQLGFEDRSNQPFETRLIEVGAIRQGLECIMKLVRYETCGNTGKVGATGSKGLWMTGDLDLVNKMEDTQEEIRGLFVHAIAEWQETDVVLVIVVVFHLEGGKSRGRI